MNELFGIKFWSRVAILQFYLYGLAFVPACAKYLISGKSDLGISNFAIEIIAGLLILSIAFSLEFLKNVILKKFISQPKQYSVQEAHDLMRIAINDLEAQRLGRTEIAILAISVLARNDFVRVVAELNDKNDRIALSFMKYLKKAEFRFPRLEPIELLLEIPQSEGKQ